ncbi:MAG TPA: SBBP repeat-containing protein [Fimbriimonas sp.]|nr:SBBP repeat-containing protein [Fimbriimonas sp.]
MLARNRSLSRLLAASGLLAILSSIGFAQTLDWEVFYPDAGSSETCGRLVRTDNSGNLLVSGVDETDTNDTLILAKYDANGVQQWLTTYDPTGDNFFEVEDMAIDADNNLVVVGNSYGDTANWVVTKIAPDGSTLWTKTEPDYTTASLAISPTGHIYVVGSSLATATQDIVVRHIGPGGATFWTKHIDGAGATDDSGQNIAIDGDGNLLVAGYSIGTDDIQRFMKLSPEGVKLWGSPLSISQEDVHPVKIIPAPSGGSYVASNDSGVVEQLGIISHYDVDGELVWRKYFNISATGTAAIADMCLDASGNILVAGDGDSGSGSHVVLRKMDTSGTKIWQRNYDAVASYSLACRVLVAPDNSIYIVGSVLDDGFKTLVLKYSSAGTLTWDYAYQGSEFYDEAMDATLSGNAVVGLSMSQVTPDREAMHLFQLR